MGWLALLTLTLSGYGCKSKKAEVPQVPAVPAEAEPPVAPSSTAPAAPGAPLPAPVPTGPVVEKEPNDTREQATPLPMNGGIRGTVTVEVAPVPELKAKPKAARPKAPPADEDWFVLVLEGPRSQMVRLQLSPDDTTDFALAWMAPDSAPAQKRGEAIVTIDAAASSGVEILPPTVLPPGRHYFRVTPARPRKTKPVPVLGAGAYRLTTTVTDPPDTLEREPNGQSKEAATLKPDVALEGYMGWPGDVDCYRLDLEAATPTSVFRVEVGAVQEVKTVVRLVDRQRRVVAQVPEGNVAWSPGRPVVIRDVGFDPQSAPYYVEVRAQKGSNANDRYTIRVVVEQPEAAHEREPNWKTALAQPLTADRPTDGFVSHPTDWDVFRIDAEAASVATVVVTGIPGVDVQIERLDATGKAYGTVNEVGAGQPETFPLLSVGPEPAYVRVSSKDKSFSADKGYRISVSLVAAGDREMEPNDDAAQASGRQALVVGPAYHANIHPKGDVDLFVVQITGSSPDETKILTLNLTGAEGLRLSVELLDGQQKLIAKKAGIAPGETRTLTHGFTPGRYFLRIKDETGQAANANAVYTVQIAE